MSLSPSPFLTSTPSPVDFSRPVLDSSHGCKFRAAARKALKSVGSASILVRETEVQRMDANTVFQIPV